MFLNQKARVQNFYKKKISKTVSLDLYPEGTIQQVTKTIQDKKGIGPCNVSLTKIDTRCHCENFTLQGFLVEDILEETQIPGL